MALAKLGVRMYVLLDWFDCSAEHAWRLIELAEVQPRLRGYGRPISPEQEHRLMRAFVLGGTWDGGTYARAKRLCREAGMENGKWFVKS